MTFTMRFEMLSDWHVGAGYGRPGNVDRLLVRDADGLPYLPAKTIRGMWRDAAERLACGLDDGQVAGPWQKLVDDIFGSQPQLAKRDGNDRSRDPSGYHDDPRKQPRETALRVTPARLRDGLREKLKGEQPDRRALRAAVVFIKPGVAIDPGTGRALDAHLRFEEMGQAGTVLTAKATVGASVSEAAKALMLAATKLITRVGGKRRRGAGKCAVTVIGEDGAGAIAILRKHESPSDDSTAKPNANSGPVVIPTEAKGGWVSIPLTITLHGPVAIPARTVGNVVESLDFVPGTFLLPHITRFLEGHGINARGAIARGDVRVLNATLEVNGAPGRPVPMHLFHEKGKDIREAINRFLDPRDDGQLKQLRAGYVAAGRFGTVEKQVRTHNVVEDGPQRPTTDVRGVYSFEAIAPRTVLRSELRVREGLVPANINWAKLDGDVRLGVSKKDDYGEAKLSVEAEKPIVREDGTKEDGDLFVWLLSDVLLRGDGLQAEPTVGALECALGKRLGVTLKAETQFVRARRTESWHTGWGLPRPSMVGLQAGSCVRFQVTETIDSAKLAAVAASGIGERTAEGFGQVSFNHPLLAKHESTTPWLRPASGDKQANGLRPEPLGDDDRSAAKHIERAAWRKVIELAALSATATPEQRKTLFGWDSAKPNMSQLGGLRAAIQFLKSVADRDRVLGWLKAVKDNHRRCDKWPSNSLDTLITLIEKPTIVWGILRPVPSVEWPLISRTQSDLEIEFWAFAVRSLLDAAVRAHKREGEK